MRKERGGGKEGGGGRERRKRRRRTTATAKLVCQINIHAVYFLSKMPTILNPCVRLALDRAVNRNKRHRFIPIKAQGKDAIKYFILNNISSMGDHLR